MNYYKMLLFSHPKFLKIIIFQNQQIICEYQREINYNFQEILFETLDLIKIKQNIEIKNINQIYSNIGPGSYLVYRIVVTFLKTIAVLNDHLSLFVIDNLLWQIENQKPSCSLVSVNKNSYYFQEFENFLPTSKIKLLSKFEQKKLKSSYKEKIIYFDFSSFSLSKQFFLHQKRFQKIKNIEKLKAIEINTWK